MSSLTSEAHVGEYRPVCATKTPVDIYTRCPKMTVIEKSDRASSALVDLRRTAAVSFVSTICLFTSGPHSFSDKVSQVPRFDGQGNDADSR